MFTDALPNLLILGAAGHVGSALVQSLNTLYRDRVNIIGAVHSQVDAQHLRSSCAMVAEYDWDKIDTLAELFSGSDLAAAGSTSQRIDYVFIVPSHDENRVEQVERLMDCAIAHGHVRYVILLSLIGTNSRAGTFASQFKDMETCVEESGIPYTFLQCALFQHLFLMCAPQLAQELPTIALPLGMGGFAPVHTSDVASVASVLLSDPAAHRYQRYQITGPEVLTGVMIAGKAAEGLGLPVRFQSITSDEARQQLEQLGFCDAFIDGQLELYDLIRDGFFAHVSPDVGRLTYFRGATLVEFFREHRGYFLAYDASGGGGAADPDPPSTQPSQRERRRDLANDGPAAETHVGSKPNMRSHAVTALIPGHLVLCDGQGTLRNKRVPVQGNGRAQYRPSRPRAAAVSKL
ncbi:hypothetical protein CXG81DRAFT_25911 [Caulochytrium protostelioides]|uniref:NmrA-like domain-containing protein n=1 Tax=Caulochytrium protostelioides TaxID=1555241 RepID=A0A4P9X824_9FUNG|nr:hypothetical protein CXG81DRAFT_25911 [Caulochytrium protostelioides]|eukprot:RKP01417.1 hypothetical protein CXG81DRAFT_25911 [Caulochytrium protostelioides]